MYLRSLLKGPRIAERVRFRILEALNTFELRGRNIVYEDLVIRYVRKAVQRDLELLEHEQSEAFEILGLELRREMEIDGFRFIGFIDRLDRLRPGEIRVVDYKTGRVSDSDFLITEENAGEVVEALFGEDEAARPKIALQLYLYGRLAAPDAARLGGRIVNSVYQTSRLFVHEVEHVALNERFLALMEERLRALLAEIADPAVPWRRCADPKTCEWCDFKNICGR